VKNLEDERWHCFNDANVSPVYEQEMLSDQQVYLLFIIRRKSSLKSYSDCNGDDVLAPAGVSEMEDVFTYCNDDLEFEINDDIKTNYGYRDEDVFSDSN